MRLSLHGKNLKEKKPLNMKKCHKKRKANSAFAPSAFLPKINKERKNIASIAAGWLACSFMLSVGIFEG